MRTKFLFLLVFASLVISQNCWSRALDTATQVGFTGCNSAINEVFDYYDRSSSGRISVDYFRDNPSNISITTTFGSSGDSVFINAAIIKEGSSCYVYETSKITVPESCIQYKEENPVWSYVESQADFVWTKNKGGVDALLQTLPNGGCSIIFNQSRIFPRGE